MEENSKISMPNSVQEKQSRNSNSLSVETSKLIEICQDLNFQPVPKQSKVRSKLAVDSKDQNPFLPYADCVEAQKSSSNRNGSSHAKSSRAKQGSKPGSIGSPQTETESQPYQPQQQQQPSKVRSKLGLNNNSSHQVSRISNSNSLPQLKSISAGNSYSLAYTKDSDAVYTGFSVDFGKMKERIEELQHANENLTYLLEKKGMDFQNAEHQLHKLLLELDKSKRQNQEMMERVEDRHRAELLNIKDAHSKDMAVLSFISIKNAYSSLEPTGSSPRMSIEDYMEANKKLAENVETLQKTHHKTIDEFQEEKKLITMDHNKKMLAAEKEAKAEILSLRSKIIAHEDVISTQQEDLQKALSKLEATNKLNRQLEKTRDDMADNLNKATTEVKSLQQSLASNFRFEAANNFSTTGSNSSSVVATSGAAYGNFDQSSSISDAKVSSKMKQMTNKIEFLKAQLETEQSSVEDLKNALNSVQRKLNELRYEYNLKVQDMDEVKKAAVEEAEKRVEGIYEERMVELTTLQTKAIFYESQLNEGRNEVAIAKQREEATRGVLAKAQAQNNTLKAEIERNVTQLSELQQELDKQATKTENAYQNDAIIRRLDNERQYLKSQVTAEMTLKNELQNALVQLQKQLSETSHQWKGDVDTLKNENAELSQKLVVSDKNHQQALINMDAECKRLTIHNAELKNAYGKARDQMRVDILMIEDYRSLNKRMEAEIAALKVEIEGQHLSKAREADTHQKKLDEASTLLSDTEYELKNEILNLKEELAKQLISISSTQNESKTLHDQHIAKRLDFHKKLAAFKIFQTINKMKQCRLSSYLRVWSTKTTLNGAAAQFRENVKLYEAEFNKKSEEVKTRALEDLRTQLAKEFDDTIVGLKKEHDDRIFDIKSNLIFDKTNVQTDLIAKHEKEMKQQENMYNAQLNEAKAAHALEVSDIEHRLSKDIETLSRTIVEQKALFTEGNKKYIEDVKKETEDAWRMKLEMREVELKSAHEAQQAKLDEAALQRFENLLKTAKADWKKKINDKEAEAKATIEKLEKKQNQEVIKFMAGLEESLAQSNEANQKLEEKVKEYSQKLENAEDSLFDLKESLKYREKEFSIQLWRQLTGMQSLKLSHKKVLESVAKQTLIDKGQISRDHHNVVDNLKQLLAKLFGVIQQMEKNNKKTLKVLSSHKVDIVADKRKFIRELHTDLDSIDKKSDIYQQQRREIIEEVHELQQQVKVLEETIRVHNSESSIQNGKINTAHNKKKKRLDEELEKYLESIEHNGKLVRDLEEKIAEVSKLKVPKEAALIETEKELVDILVEQQRLVHKTLNDNNDNKEEKVKVMFESSGVTWPLATAATGSLLRDDDHDDEL